MQAFTKLIATIPMENQSAFLGNETLISSIIAYHFIMGSYLSSDLPLGEVVVPSVLSAMAQAPYKLKFVKTS